MLFRFYESVLSSAAASSSSSSSSSLSTSMLSSVYRYIGSSNVSTVRRYALWGVFEAKWTRVLQKLKMERLRPTNVWQHVQSKGDGRTGSGLQPINLKISIDIYLDEPCRRSGTFRCGGSLRGP